QAVESYIAVRRATGFAFRSEGSLLQSFAAFSDATGKHYVSSQTAIEWAGSAPSLSQRARRLGQVIRFAVHSCGGSTPRNTAHGFRQREAAATGALHFFQGGNPAHTPGRFCAG